MDQDFDEDGQQKDDGSRNALDVFMEHKADSLPDFLSLLNDQGEYWKARVLLELLWEYESSKRTKFN